MRIEPSHIPNYLVLLCAIIGMMRWARLNAAEKLILLIVALNVTVDMIAIYYDRQNPYNHLMYSLSTLLGHLISFIVYVMTLKKKEFHQGIYLSGILFLVFALINFTMNQGIYILNTYTFIFGSILLVIASYYILRMTILYKDIDRNDLILWFALANLIYSSVVIPIVGLLPWLQEVNPELNKLLFTRVNKAAYILWTLLIMTGFLCKTRKTTFSL